ncbi:MAG: hypothetical protein J6N95_06830 [Bacilli bacterium]|nr:hypothetical protein [Bacilli bacterium]
MKGKIDFPLRKAYADSGEGAALHPCLSTTVQLKFNNKYYQFNFKYIEDNEEFVK